MQHFVCRRVYRRASGPDDMAICLTIRHIVFVVGQNVPAALECDGREDECAHYLAFDGSMPIATARVMPLDGKFKFQRVAVVEAYRGKGVGDALMRFMMTDLVTHDDAAGRRFFLSSQTSAIGFYEQLGFVTCSDEYMDAGIAHKDMDRAI